MTSTDQRLTEIAGLFVAEVKRARLKHPTMMRSRHEGYAILLEEVEELWDEIKNDHYTEATRKEAIQVGAMALALIAEVLDHENGQRQ